MDADLALGAEPPSMGKGIVMRWRAMVLAGLGMWAALAQSETLVVFGGDSFAPTTYLVNGKPAGTLVDILKKVGEKTGDEYEIRLYPWKRAYLHAERGEGAIVGLSNTPKRQEIFDFSEPMYYNELRLVVAKGKEFPFTRLADLNGRTVGGGLGVSYGAEVDQAVESGLVTMERDTDPSVRLQKVLLGQLQVAIIGHGGPGLEHILKGHPRLVDRGDELSVLPTPLTRDALYLAASKTMKQGAVLARFNKALVELQHGGQIKALR